MNLLERNPLLREILATGRTVAGNGETIVLSSYLDGTAAEALFRQVSALRPEVVVEVGMANGISTLAILTALEANGTGRLISIDPNQSTQWRDSGRTAVKRSGLAHRHTVMEEPDYLALPRLLEAGTKVDFSYIDGWHTFDYALVDFWFLDKMTLRDGVVAFNDCGWPAVAKAIDFVLSHRRYREYGVGLAKAYARPDSLRSFLSRIRHGRFGEYFLQRQDRYFRKLEAWEPSHDFYARF